MKWYIYDVGLRVKSECEITLHKLATLPIDGTLQVISYLLTFRVECDNMEKYLYGTRTLRWRLT